MKIWRWWGRDVLSLHDLELVAAVTSRRELHELTVRLRLPKPKNDAGRVRRDSELGALALDNPGRLVWRDTGDPDGSWRGEEELAEARRRATALRVGQDGRLSVPLHRSNPTYG